jgi:hypothetical protein
MSSDTSTPLTAGSFATPASAADRIDAAALALLSLTSDSHGRCWKAIDWDVLGRLHARGLIGDPVGKAKSVAMTPEGQDLARALRRQLFGME